MNKPRFDTDSGFSLLEVLVAILIVTFFTTVAMQMVIVSTAFRARAKEYATATKLIEQDLENIRSLANQYEFPTISATPSPSATPSILSLSSGNGLKHNDKIQFLGSPNVYTITAPTSIPTANPTITISPGITPPPTPSPGSTVTPTPVGIGTRVVSNTVCNPTPSPTASPTTPPDTTKGLAKYLFDVTQSATYVSSSPAFTPSPVPTPTPTPTYKAVNNYAPYTIPGTQMRLWLMRSDSHNFIGATPPYDVLQVKYIVAGPEPRPTSSFYGTLNTNAPKIVAELTSEVIPNASFQCIR